MEDWIFSIGHDTRDMAEAERRVASAMAALDPARTGGNSHLRAQLKEREERVRRALPRPGLIEAIVARWIGARAVASIGPDTRLVAARLAHIADEAAALQQDAAQVAAALSSVTLTAKGEEVAQAAQIAAAALAEAQADLALARAAGQSMAAHAPDAARGRAGALGALRDATPDETLAQDLARVWTGCGLSLDGGRSGDGLDVVLGALIGEALSRKMLAGVRARIVNGNL